MRTKNFWGLLAILTVTMISAAFMSCSSDDEEDESYNLTDQEAFATLQGTWDIAVTEEDDEGVETDYYVWEVNGNTIAEKKENSSMSHSTTFTIVNGVFIMWETEEYKFTKLNANSFHCYSYYTYDKGEVARVDISGKRKK